MKIFSLKLEGDFDSDGDGAPDLMVDLDLFGADVFHEKFNVDLGSLLKAAGSVAGLARNLIGLKG